MITLSWSPTSGHTVLAADGREVKLRDGRKMPLVGVGVGMQRLLEESWVLGEEGGIIRSNDVGIHLRVVARAVPPRGGGGRSPVGGKKKKKKRKRERQFDLFIDGRSYFDLPRLDESGHNLVVAAPPAPSISGGGGGGSSKFGSYHGKEEREMSSNCQVDEVEEWTADSSAIADGPSGNSNDDDDDDDDDSSVDGFMENIDLGAANLRQRGEDDDRKQPTRSTRNNGTTTTAAMRRAKIGSVKELQEKGGRAAEKIGTSTKQAVAETSRRAEEGVKKLKAGTTKVLTSPIALMKRSSLADEEIQNGIDTSDEDGGVGLGGGGSDSDGGGNKNTKEETVHRLAPEDYPSFHSMHQTIMQQQNSSGDGGVVLRDQIPKHREDAEETADQTIGRLRDQISHLELAIANNDHRVAAEVERSVAVAEIEARMLQMEDRNEISRLREELEELRTTASQSEKLGLELVSAYEELEKELVAAKSEAERLKESAEEAREEAQSLKADKAATDEEIRRLEQRVINLQEALDAARAKKPRPRGAPFVPNDAMTSYLDDPKCCLCSKDATENMRDCQCGQESCDLRAHGSCLIGSKHNPSPSVSHPGTPAPALPLILCGGIFKK